MNRIEKLVLALMVALPVAFLAFGGTVVMADDDDDEEEEHEERGHGRDRHRAPTMPGASPETVRAVMNAVKEECGSCHIPYPAGMLPAASWSLMMNDLENHFGTDATLGDAAITKQITEFLVANGGDPRRLTGVKGDKAPLRISETRWFVREHDEVRADVWKRPSIKSAANCGACHQRAAEGDFEEDAIRIPKK